MNNLFILIYVILFITVCNRLLKKDLKWFIIFFGLLFCFSPLMQYVIFPEYKTTLGYRSVSLHRIFFEYVNTFILIVATLTFRTLKTRTNALTVFKFLLLLWFVFNLLSVYNSIEISRSIGVFFMTIVNPILFAFLFNNRKILENSMNFLLTFFTVILLFNLGVKYFSVLYNLGRGAISVWSIGYGAMEFGTFRSNSGTNFLSIFLPLAFLKSTFIKNERLRKYFEILKWIIIFTFIITGSRMGYFVFGLGLIIAFYTKQINFKQGLNLLLVAIIASTTFAYLNEESIFDFLENRFTNKGDTAIESAENDERLLLWENALEDSQNNSISGVGAGNYFLVYEKYSNSHNLFVNILFERGILVLILLVSLIIFALRRYKRNLRILMNPEEHTFFSLMGFGLILYLVASLTGDSFISISQTVHSFPAYIFMVFISFPFFYYNFKMNNSERIN